MSGRVVNTPEMCSEQVNRNGGNSRWPNFEPCGRPAFQDGLCKLHYKVRERREAKSREYQEARIRGRTLRDEAERLSEQLGIKVEADFSWHQGEYNGNFVVPGDWLRALAEGQS
jgi:hypothetical protein